MFLIDYDIYLYDRAGHGFSSHFPRGSDNSHACNLRDLRTVVRGLGWEKDKFSFFAHSYGGHLSMAVKISISSFVFLSNLFVE